MSLTRVGGKSDGGIDLIGWWWLPDLVDQHAPRRRIRVLAQCKAEKKKMGPHYVRETEGVLYRFMSDSVDSAEQPSPTVGLLLSQSAFTKEALLRANSSRVPLFLLHIPQSEQSEQVQGAHFGSAVWNAALGGEKGLLKGEIQARWEWPQDGNGIGRPGLWFRGRRLENWVANEKQ